ncbi:MAG: DUF819 family protein [Ginsengibacter sp.]
MPVNTPLITDDAVVFGLLSFILFIVFYTNSSNKPFFKKFYSVVPALLLCYFIPGLMNSFGIISGESSGLYKVASRYLLPASLVLFTLSLDLKEIWKLRKMAGLMFITGTIGIIIGGPIALYIVSRFVPDLLGGEGPEETWRGLSTIAGSWIGGGANQAAMFEVFKPGSKLFSAAIAVDVIVANIWMAILLYGTGINDRLNRFFKADSKNVDELKTKIENYRLSTVKMPGLSDTMMIVGLSMGVMGLSHFFGDAIAGWISVNAPHLANFSLTSSFFWLVLIATLFGIILSFTPARKLEGAGASRIGSVFLYFLVATIGMQMDLMAIFSQPALFAVGLIWVSIHAILLIIIGRIAKIPFFFLAVGSQANIGGAASAPIVASAFHTALAPVGVLLAVFGYALGTYGAYVTGLLMRWVSGG